jgi:glyoxylase-like metal-dependent hydrolase (beta-lactamase superfamily II)
MKMKKIYNNPEIFQIKIPLPENPLRELNSYLIRSGDESLLIDTGFHHPASLHALQSALDEIGVRRQAMHIFLTHLHTDHIGSVCDVSDENTIIYMSEPDYVRYRNSIVPGYWDISDQAVLKEGFSAEGLEQIVETNPARKYMPKDIFYAQHITDGTQIQVGNTTCICVMTNGHSPGHCSLYLPEQEIMFLGDHILYDITPNITAWLGVEDSLGDYLKNLEKMKQYPMQMALPGHRVASKGVLERIEEIKVHHQIRLDGTIRIIKEHPGYNADQIAAQLKWSMRGKSWDEFPMEQKWFAVGETVAHLDYLRHQNVIYKEMEDGIYRYFMK